MLSNYDARKVKDMKHQVGGHPMLTYESEYVMKPLNSDCRGFREVLFYEILAEIDDHSGNCFTADVSQKNCNLLINYEPIAVNSSLLRALKPFCPNYFGIVNSPNSSEPDSVQTHIVLSDITSNYKKPCVLDLKIGQRTYEPDAPLEKQESQHNKYPEQQIHGFRIVGMNIYDPNHSESDALGYRCFGKKFGMQLKQKNDIRAALCMFFKLNKSTHLGRYEVVQNVMTEMIQIQQIHRELNRGMAFYASSLLIVVEGDDECFSPEKYSVKMIDFSHVRFNSFGDSSYMYGLESLIDILNDIREI
jgi:1D-myo-inositol-tetrakisphosphate 5-kinase/inositol-polyphosphate multikinase